MKEDKISFQCKSLVKLIERYLFNSLDEEPLKQLMPNPTISQIRIIGYIVNSKDEVYQRDLEKALNLRRATVSGIMHTMEKNNLIRRVSINKDARVKKVVLTSNAQDLFLEQMKRIDNLEHNLTKNIKPKDLKIFIKVLGIMKDNLRENPQE